MVVGSGMSRLVQETRLFHLERRVFTYPWDEGRLRQTG